MDPSTFDTLARSFATPGTRRRLVTLLAALPLGGALTTLGQDEAAAERPIDRLQRRTPQRNRKQRNTKKNNNQNNNQNNNKKNNKNQNVTNPPGGGRSCSLPGVSFCEARNDVNRFCGQGGVCFCARGGRSGVFCASDVVCQRDGPICVTDADCQQKGFRGTACVVMGSGPNCGPCGGNVACAFPCPD